MLVLAKDGQCLVKVRHKAAAVAYLARAGVVLNLDKDPLNMLAIEACDIDCERLILSAPPQIAHEDYQPTARR